jgi:uncharacterized protein (DUF1800 family)
MVANLDQAQPGQGPRRLTRRKLVGGALAAGSVAVAYAAVGGRLPLLGGNDPAVEADTDAIKQESVRISHLLRRAGFGVTKEEHDHYQSLGLDATIDELVNYTAVNDDAALALANEVTVDQQNRNGVSLWWLIRMANTKRPLQEKMTLFWHGLLTSQISVVRDPVAMVAQNELFRSYAFDSFPAILRAVSMDPAMMVYLDTSGSVQRAPNENYARELMELFALGEGNYTEEDVREAARAFTGWQVQRDRAGGGLGDPVFREDQFDEGIKTFLGRSGRFYADDIIDIITEQQAAAAYITRRLFSFFIYEDPSDEVLAPFIDVYNANDKRIGPVVEAMLRSDVFYSPRAYRALIKSPIEYVVGAVKALGAQTVLNRHLGIQQGRRGSTGALGAMGQVPFEPPNVAGWPGGASWLNSATIFARLNFINQITSGGGATDQSEAAADEPVRLGPRERLRLQQQASVDNAAGLGTVSEALAHYLPLVLDDNLPAEARQVLIDYGGGPDAALTPETLRGLAYLVLASPQFQLA